MIQGSCLNCTKLFETERAYPPRKFCSPTCRTAWNNARQAEDPEKRNRQSRESHHRHKEKANERRRQYHAQHRETENAKMRQWYAAHRDEELPKHRQWHEEHKGEANAGRRERYFALSPEQKSTLIRRQEVKARQQYPWSKLLRSAKARAKKKGVPFLLTEEWAKDTWTGRCALTSLNFKLDMPGRSGPHPLAPSLDRIRPEKGYVPDNCRFIIWAVNAFKGESTDAMMYGIAAVLLHCEPTESPEI